MTHFYLLYQHIRQDQKNKWGDAFIGNVVSKYCMPDYIIMDQNSTLMSSLMSYLYKKLNIMRRPLSFVLSSMYTCNKQFFPNTCPAASRVL